MFLLYGFSDISIWQGLSFVPGVLAAATAFALAAWVGRDLRFGVGKPEEKLGITSSVTSELSFEGMQVPRENLLGKEREGFKIAGDEVRYL